MPPPLPFLSQRVTQYPLGQTRLSVCKQVSVTQTMSGFCVVTSKANSLNLLHKLRALVKTHCHSNYCDGRKGEAEAESDSAGVADVDSR